MTEDGPIYVKTKPALAMALHLFTLSKLHHDWTVSDLARLLIPPIMLGHYLFWTEGERVVAFATWANLTEEAEDAYLTGRRKLQPEDWNAGDYSRIWIIDAVAPYGHIRPFAKAIRTQLVSLAEHHGWPATSAKWKRRYPKTEHEVGERTKIGEVRGRPDA